MSAVEPLRAADRAPEARDPLKPMPDAVRTKIADQARRILVPFGLLFKPYDRSEGIDDDDYYRFGFSFDVKNLVKNRQRQQLLGVLVDGDGTFVADALEYDWRHVESVVAYAPDGHELPARPVALSRHGSLMWFSAEGLRRELPACTRRRVAAGDEVASASADLDQGHFALEIQPKVVAETLWLDPPRPGRMVPWIPWEKPEALFSKDGDWIGVAPRRSALDADGAWRVHPDELVGDRIAFERFQQAAAGVSEALEKRLVTVQLRFRLEAGTPSPSPGEGFLDKEDQTRSLKERTDVALPLSNDVILVPADLPRDLARRLESVTIQSQGEPRKGRFVGVLRELDAYLVAAEPSPALRAPSPRERGDGLRHFAGARNVAVPEDETLFLAHDVRYFGGRVDLRPHPEFFLGRQRAYRDALTRKPAIAEHPQTAVYSTLEGEAFGVMLRQRRFEGEPEKETWNEPKPMVRFYSTAELDRFLADPAQVVDPLIQPQALGETRRKPWLGAQTQGITPDLAKELRLERETQDGTRGQMISYVYPGSPAQRLGLVPGDILLKLRDRGKKDDLAIAADAESSEDGQDGRWWRSWFIHKTPLTEALGRLGVGAQVEVTYAHDHAVRTASLTLEEGPRDFESAPKYKAPRTGLTAKNITYDVRHVLRLDGIQGVLVYDVDSGSPANIAEIDPMDLVIEVEGKPVPNLAAFSALIAEEQAKGSETVRLRLRYLNDTRFADLKFSPAGEKEGPATSVMDAEEELSDVGTEP